MSIETNDNFDEIINIIETNIVSPALNNKHFKNNKAYTVGVDCLQIMLDLKNKILHFIRHDGKEKKYNTVTDEIVITKIFDKCEEQIKKQEEQLQQEQEKMYNITEHQKILEQVKYIASIPQSVLSIENAGGKENQYGVAYVKHFTYSTRNTSIQYSKWIVECYNSAKYMQLHGHDKHDKLVKGSGVKFLRKKNDQVHTFYGKEAEDIIRICENLHMQEILTKTNNNQR